MFYTKGQRPYGCKELDELESPKEVSVAGTKKALNAECV